MSTSARHQPAPAMPKRRWWQYSLGAMFVVVTVCGVLIGVMRYSAERQRAAVEAVVGLGGTVHYKAAHDGQSIAAPKWLREAVGRDYFETVVAVELTDPRVVDTDLHVLAGLDSLDFLSLNNTQVTDAGLEHVAGLSSLRTLSLGNTQVSDSGLAHVAGLTSLQSLSLGNTQTSDTGVKHLAALKELKSLSLISTKVTDQGLIHLSGLLQLEELLLMGTTPVTDAGIAKLQEALPDCSINLSRPRAGLRLKPNTDIGLPARALGPRER